jgi:WD40 repeat protein
MVDSLCELLDRGVVVRAHEAVAIVQQLINNGTSRAGSLPAGPPSVTSVHLQNDGQAIAAACDVTPSVFDAATLLQSILPAGAGQVPGALRYTIARGLLEVVAPPFESIGDFSRALERFERGDRRAAVRELLNRMPAAEPPVRAPLGAVPAAVPFAVAFEEPLDLELKPAHVAALPAVPGPAPESFGRLWAVAAVLVAAVALAAVANVARIGAFRPRVLASATSVPQSDSRTVPRSDSGTVRGTDPRTVPQSDSGTVPQSDSGTVPQSDSGTVPRSDSGTVPQSDSGMVGGTVSGTAGSLPPAEPGAVSDSVIAAGTEGSAEIVSAVDAQQRPIFSPAFASNGSAMFFHTGSTNDQRSALATVQAPFEGAADLHVMTIVDDGARNYHVQPSPDGRFVAFDSDRDGERGVYIANRDGSEVRRISGSGYAAVPTWSPDGRRLAYIRAEPDRPRVWNLWLQAVDGTEATRLTQHRYGQTWNASWFPDNRRICYTHEDKIVLMDLETRRIWSFDSPVKGHLARTPAVSPDGTKVIFQVARDGAWILDLSDRSMRRVLADPTAEEFAWSPDGRRVAFHSRRDGQWGIYILHQS